MRYGEIDGMSRKVEGILLGFGILAAVTVILAGADAGSASHCAVPLPKWVGCVLALHEGLAGGLIGAGGTIFAGWLAWSGVREQIQSERELSTAAERGNLGAILAEMGELFDVFNEVWRAIDLALLRDQTQELRRYRIAVAKTVLTSILEEKWIRDLKDLTGELAKEIAPTKRGQFIRVWQSIDSIYKAIREEGDSTPADNDGRVKFDRLRIQLSHFERYLIALDEPTSRAFAARTHREVDHRGIAAQIKPIVDSAERGEIQ